jgi:hypothetical protein
VQYDPALLRSGIDWCHQAGSRSVSSRIGICIEAAGASSHPGVCQQSSLGWRVQNSDSTESARRGSTHTSKTSCGGKARPNRDREARCVGQSFSSSPGQSGSRGLGHSSMLTIHEQPKQHHQRGVLIQMFCAYYITCSLGGEQEIHSQPQNLLLLLCTSRDTSSLSL